MYYLERRGPCPQPGCNHEHAFACLLLLLEEVVVGEGLCARDDVVDVSAPLAQLLRHLADLLPVEHAGLHPVDAGGENKGANEKDVKNEWRPPRAYLRIFHTRHRRDTDKR